ncbi:MAG: hypothetical protein PBV01_22830 [Brucella anthropi]
MLRRAAMLLALSLSSAPTFAADLRVYGPGGPQPAIEEAAREFGRQRGVEIAVVAGPTPTLDRPRPGRCRSDFHRIGDDDGRYGR